MTDQHENEGIVIDVTPEQDLADETNKVGDGLTEPVPATSPEGSGPSRIGWIGMALAAAALAITSIGAWIGYQHLSQVRQDIQQINSSLLQASTDQETLQQVINRTQQDLRSQQQSIVSQADLIQQQTQSYQKQQQAFQDQGQRLDGERTQMELREAELRATVADVHRRIGRSSRQWMVSEAEHLIRLANQHIILENDIKTAQLALEMADRRLLDTQDPGWNAVRDQLAKDIIQLSTFETPDLSGISSRLSALIDLVPELRLAGATSGPSHSLPEAQLSPRDERRWDTLLSDLWDGFKNAIRIRHRDKPVQAMLAPESEFFLYENLKLHLEITRLAVAQGNNEHYQQQIQRVLEWLGQFFDPEDAATISAKSTLEALAGQTIRSQRPDISRSLDILKVRERMLTDLATTPSAPVEETPE